MPEGVIMKKAVALVGVTVDIQLFPADRMYHCELKL